MLILQVAGSTRGAPLLSTKSLDMSIESRRGSLQHLWRILQREVRDSFTRKLFVKEFECRYFEVSKSVWILVICTIQNDGTLLIQDGALKEPIVSVVLPSSDICGHIGKNFVQIVSQYHTVLLSVSNEYLGRICATLYTWSRMRPMGIMYKEYVPPPGEIEYFNENNDLVLRCQLDACFTEFNADLQRWSPYCATLNRKGVLQLQVDDHTKPFYCLRIYDILSSQIVQVDPSVVGSNQVILLFPDMGGPKSVYLKLKDVCDYEDWVAVLKALSKQPVAAPFNKDPSKCVRWNNRLAVKVASCRLSPEANGVYEANNFTLANSYVEICLNRWAVARTSINSNPKVANWLQSFEILDPETAFSGSFQIEFKLRVCDQKMENHYTIGSFELDSSEFKDGWQWVNFVPVGFQLQIDCNFGRIPVLDSFFYQKLQSMMTSINYMLPSKICEAYPSSLPMLFPIFNEVYRAQGLQLNWILNLAIHEIEKINLESDTLFRGSSLFTRAFEYLLQNEGREILQKTVAKVIEALVKKTHNSLELDPSRVSDRNELIEHQRLMSECVICLWKSIKKYGPPKASVPIFRQMKIKLKSMGVEESQITRIMNRTLSAFLFLRFYGPALLNPQAFNMPDWILETHHHRTLMLITKIIQSLANGVRFGTKEMWLVPMNSIIDQYGCEVERWYADICDIGTTGGAHVEQNEIIDQVNVLERPSKQVPVSTFMGQQLSSPNLIDESATYSQLVNMVSQQLANEPKKSDDTFVNEFIAECHFIVTKQNEILRSLEEPDLFEESAQGECPNLLLNMETLLFGSDRNRIKDDTIPVKRNAFQDGLSKILSPKSRKGADDPSNDAKQKSGGSLKRFKEILRINKPSSPN